MKHIGIYINLLICIFVLINCGLSEKYGGIKDLKSQLQNEYPDERITIALSNNDLLSVSFINSQIALKEKKEKQQATDSIFDFIRSNYSDINEINTVGITYAVKKNYIIFRYSHAFDTCIFRREGDKWVKNEIDITESLSDFFDKYRD